MVDQPNRGNQNANQQNVEKIRSQLRGVNFPTTKDELIQKKGDQRLDLGGRNVMFRELLQDVRQDRFQSEQDLINNISESGKLGGPRS